MMKMVDTLMVLLFPFLDCIPFTLPRYWLFRDRLRIPFRYIVLIQIALAAVYSGVFYQINLGGLEAAARWTTITRYCFLLPFSGVGFPADQGQLSKAHVYLAAVSGVAVLCAGKRKLY